MNGGSAWAMGRIGELYKTCTPEFVVVCDKRRGTKFIQQAALKGDIRTQSNLAGMYWKNADDYRATLFNAFRQMSVEELEGFVSKSNKLKEITIK